MRKVIYTGILIILLSIKMMASIGIPIAPINIGVYNITDTDARISFKDMSDNEIGFNVKDVNENQLITTIASSDINGLGKYQYINLRRLKPLTLYTITIIAYNNNGEASSLRKSFRTLKSTVISSKLIVNAGEDKNLSFGKSIVIRGIASSRNSLISSYIWKEGDEILANTASFTYVPSSKGIKTLTLTVVDDNGEKATDTINIMVFDKKIVSINDFGAIPNDNKDDSEAIKKALNVNGHIRMNRGVYNVHGVIRLDKETIIDGNGSTFISILDTINNGRSSKNILTLKGNKIIIKNLTLDGAYTNGNAKELNNVSSLLHIYDSENILLDGINTINHASNWWSSKNFNLTKLNSNHKIDMYHVIYIGFSNNITIKNMEQKGNIKTEGLLIYESDNIKIDGFKSFNSPNIWTSLNIIASDNINMNNIEVGDGRVNQGGSSINFIANHHFTIKNTKTTTKQGFDISNEIKVKGLKGRITRDTSYGIFENCYFKGQRGLYGYPTINKNEDLTFKNTKFIPTKEGYATWGARIQKAGTIKFENCTFGNEKYKTFGIIMGNTDKLTITNSKFINNNMGIYIYDKKFGKIIISNNNFDGDNYYPLRFSGAKGRVNELHLYKNKTKGKLILNRFYTIDGDFTIGRLIK